MAGGVKAKSSSSWTVMMNFPPSAVQEQKIILPERGVLSIPKVNMVNIRPDGVYQSQQRFGLYRWHVMDPIRFNKDLRVTIQALGWRSSMLNKRPYEEWRYLPLQDDIASTTFWYQTEPHAQFPDLPSFEYLEVI